MSKVSPHTLHDKVPMPQLGLGVFKVRDEGAEAAVATAIEAGYRSIDTAAYYRNERGVGRAVNQSSVSRDELFVTTKLWNSDHGYQAALDAFEASLERLGLDYIDLYLIHWPLPGKQLHVETWRALEKLYEDGRVRAIGVSNFKQSQLDDLRESSGIIPAINQVELHPWLQQEPLRQYHDQHGIITQAWSPLGQGALLDDQTLQSIGKTHGKTIAQVILRWHLQLDNNVIPKSVTPSRIAENIDVFDFELSAEDLSAIAALDQGTRTGPDPEVFGADPDQVFPKPK